MNAIELAQWLKCAQEAVDAKWKSLTPEEKARIVDNITKRAKKRTEEKKEGKNRD